MRRSRSNHCGNRNTVLKYFRHMELDPFDVSGQTTLSLLGELMATGAILNRAE